MGAGLFQYKEKNKIFDQMQRCNSQQIDEIECCHLNWIFQKIRSLLEYQNFKDGLSILIKALNNL
jgi:hypothetical protein